MTQALHLGGGVWRVRLGEPETFTPYKVLKPQAATELNNLERTERCPLDVAKITLTASDRGCLLRLPLGEQENVYGFGLQLKSFRQNGKKKTIRVNSDPVADTGDSHAPVPFYVSTAGYGVLVDTARYASFYCGSHLRKGASAHRQDRNAPAGATTEELYKVRQLDKTAMMVDIPVAKGVDVYLFEGPTLRCAVQRYNLFSGGGAMPPLWGLGVWYRLYTHCNDREIEEFAAMMREDGVPCDVLGFDPGWQTTTYSCSHVFDDKGFPDPDSLFKRLDAQNFRINLWDHAFTHPSSPLYEPLFDYAGDQEVWGGLVPDFSMNETAQIWQKYYNDSFVSKGVASFMLDECDNSDFIRSPWSFPEFSQFPSGMDGEVMHSLFGSLYQRVMDECYHVRGQRSWHEARSNHAFAAPKPFILYSDLYDHEDFIRGMTTAGFSGLLWTPEVRQCSSREDLLRRLQSVIFSPLALINAWMIPTAPWKQFDVDKNLAGEWLEDADELTARCREILELRMRFVPYLYAAFAKYAQTGLPPFRGLIMDYPEEEGAADVDNQWLVGDGVMVAPLTWVQANRQVYFPEGVWYDFWDGTRYIGPATYTVEKPIMQVPLYVREGTLLPLAQPQTHLEDTPSFRLEVRAYGDDVAPATLAEDSDGAVCTLALTVDVMDKAQLSSESNWYTVETVKRIK